MNEESIFLEALGKVDPSDRAQFLDQACAGDATQRQRIEKLLAAHPEAGNFLEQPAVVPGGTVAVAPAAGSPGEPASEPGGADQPGVVLAGRYQLLERIGEGGMGTVWMAQQTEPVKRLVAVKLIKAGMDSRQVIARFEAERQALALMDHPNIAKVLDGGTTGAGRPCFVMDLVKGVPITKYCDEHHLTPRQRLELFLPVCQAVQHAHQKGIIHRDLKPSNVLVALYDGKPVPKVIDFGVAKAAGQQLTDKTLVTGFGNIVGTLEYMSPEQAEVNQVDIDTRSDIYSLGVLLYELLAGSPPFTRRELEKAGVLEMLRVIREQEPSKPSAKLSTAEGLPTLAANRGTDPAKLTRLVRGELDWIVMKALDKDRSRRYETANGFAMDVQRYLADEPVLACPPSAGYRLRKFARRHKGGLAVAGLVLCFLVLLGSGAGWAVRDRSAREAEASQQQAARQGKVAGQIESILAEVDQLEKDQKWPEALAAARRAGVAVASGEADAATAERVRQRLKDLEFIDRLEQIPMELLGADGSYEYAGTNRDYARAFRDYGVDIDEMPVEASIQRIKVRPALAIPLAAALDHWAYVRRSERSGRDDPGSKRLSAVARGIDPEALRDRLRSSWGRPADEWQPELHRLAQSINVRSHHPATLRLLSYALWSEPALRVRILREAQAAYPGDFWLNYTLGVELNYSNWPRPTKEDLDGAIRFYTAAISARPSATSVCDRLGEALSRCGKHDEAIAVYRRAIDASPEGAGRHWLAIGNILRGQKKPAEAADAYGKAEAAFRQANSWHDLGEMLRAQGKPDKAIDAYRDAIKSRPERAFVSWQRIGETLRAQGKPDEAIDAFRQGIAAQPEDTNHLRLAIAGILHRQGRPDEAIAVYREAIKARPEDAGSCWKGIVGILLSQGKPDEALAAYREAIKLNQDDPLLHRSLALALRKQNKLAEANAAFDRAVENYRKDSTLPAAHRYSIIAAVLREKGDMDETIAAYRQAIDAGPEHPGFLWVAIGDIRRDQKKPAEAIAAYRKAAEAEPKNPDLHRYLGDALAERGKLDDAIASYRKSLTLDPNPNLAAYASIKIGNALHRQKKMPEAIAAYSRALELDREKMSGAYNAIGDVLRDMGNLDEAVAWYKRAIGSDPPKGIASLHASLGEVLSRQNKFDDAAGAFRKAIDAEKNSPRSHQYLAWILASHPEAKLRDPKQAVVLAKRAVELDPTSSMTWQYLGWVHYRTGDWRASIEALEKSCKVQKGGTGDAGQWIVLALAHARLAAQDGLPEKERENHRTEARRWFERADKQIDSWWRARPSRLTDQAIWDFRAEARELMGPKESKK
jgi:tetratricopeptide (TPR) repeat protein/serine/threonine protein kinase